MATVAVLRITSKKPNFRRAGLTHPATAVDHLVSDLTPAQIAALKAEPMLVVHEAEVDEEKAPAPKPAAKKKAAK
jgi:hypothetical protein